MARKITFPNMGNYQIVFKTLFENLGFEVIPPPKTSKKSVEKGLKHSPEFVCFPFKVCVGNYIQSIEEKGANTIVMLDTQGECRFQYFGRLQQKILDDSGYNISFFTFNAKNALRYLRKLGIFRNSPWRIVRAVWITLWKLKLVELIEDLSWKTRPREQKSGKTGKVMSKYLDILDKTNSLVKLRRLKREIKESFSSIEIDKSRKPLKIGIVGEIYVIAESYVHRDTDVALGNLGAEVHKAVRVSTVIKHFLNPLSKKLFYRQAYPYLKTSVGGHGQDSVAHMLEYAKEGFDGVVHLAPFGCMPEVTVRPILNQISKEKKLPLLSLSLDEQSAEAGIQTRVEAYMDLIKDKKIRN